MSYRNTFNEIEKLKPQKRGTEFEKLINKILEDNGVLVNSRYRTSDSQQEIDGAILIYNKIFLVEVKWEDEDTLAASKLFSFLGKINSKIEGTLGVFISYNELKQNFIDSVRNGLRQNCILIHGKENIENIIDEKVNLKEYIEYCFLKASTKNTVHVKTSEFISIPKNNKIKTQSKNSNNWIDIYNCLIDNQNEVQFTGLLEAKYDSSLELSKKTLNIYSSLNTTELIRKKYTILICKLINEEKDDFIECLYKKLISDDWVLFATEWFSNIIKTKRIVFESKERQSIIENITTVLNGMNWNLENMASTLIDSFYNCLDLDDKNILAKKYFSIYCDTGRMDKFSQKKFAKKIFEDFKTSGLKYFEIIKEQIIDDIKIFKVDEFYFCSDFDNQDEKRSFTIKNVISKYKLIFKDNGIDGLEFVSSEYDKL